MKTPLRHVLRLAPLAAVLCASCAPVAPRPLPERPLLRGDHPAVGRTLRLDVRAPDGGPAELVAPVGRPLALCVLAEDGAGLEPCLEAAERFGDRVAVVALSRVAPDDAAKTAPPPGPTLRVFHDPDGRALRERLQVQGGGEVVLVDRQGRVAAVVRSDAAPLEALERLLR